MTRSATAADASSTTIPLHGSGPIRPGPIRPGLTLILPAYNEADAIAHSIRTAVDALSGLKLPFEIIVVDDGSKDATAQIARNAADSIPQVRVLSTPENVGYGGALRYGFREARFELMAFTDADGQFDLSQLAYLLPAAEKFDMVCGYRIDRQDPWTRKLYSRGYNLLVRTLLGTRVRDCDCALKVFHRDQINALGLESNDFFINAELLTKARLAGLSVTEVGVSHFPRVRGESKVSIWHIIPVLQMLVRFWWSHVLFTGPAATKPVAAANTARWAAGLLLAMLASLLLLPNLSYPLIDPDEGRYAQVSREMLNSGDYIVPTRFGKPYLDKPPLIYWLTATSFRLFGISESSARLVPALAALCTLLVSYVLGARLVGHLAAWLGSLAMLSCCGFLLAGRFVFIDTLLALFTTVGLLAGYLASRQVQINRGWWSLAAVAVALGVLAKGPVAVALCLPPLVLSRWLTGLPAIRLRDWVWFGSILASLSIPWFVLVDSRESGFLLDFIWRHHVNRFMAGLSHAEPWWFYIPVLLAGAAPCSILFPAIGTFLLDSGKQTRAWRSWDLGFFVLAGGWALTLFSTSSCKLPPYILPAIPFICLVVGRGLEAILSGRVDHWFLQFVRQRSPHHLMLILPLMAALTGIVDVVALKGAVAGRVPHWIGLVAIGAVAAALSQLGLMRRQFIPWGVAFGLALGNMGMLTLDLFPGVASDRSKTNPVLELGRESFKRETPIVFYSITNEADSIAFRLGNRPLQCYEAHEFFGAVNAMNLAPEVIVLAHANQMKLLRSAMPADLRLDELGQYQYIVIGVCRPQTHVTAQK